MCGIYGIYSFGPGKHVDAGLLDRMSSVLEHRGPDSQGKHLGFEDPPGAFKLGLGHRRLAIVDHSGGLQPMHNEKETLWLVCDGEIYNYKELRQMCLERGHRFYTNCDVEVILHLYEDYGAKCLGFLRGMFAFALWDESEKKLFLARDRLGIKHLNYAFCNGSFIFASEIKAILLHPNIKRAVNWRAFEAYLTFLTTPSPATFFEGISKLAAGYAMVVCEDGRRREEEYWDVFSRRAPLILGSEGDQLRQISEAFDDAIRSHVTDGASNGIFLSGGIDSSLVTAFLSRHARSLKTFTTGYTLGDRYNEFKFAKEVSTLFSARHHEIFLGEEDFESSISPQVMRYQEEPIFEPICLSYFAARSARAEGALVCYLGSGGDELFLGYPFWIKMLQFKNCFDIFSRLPAPFRSLLLKFLKKAHVKSSQKSEIFRRALERDVLFYGSSDLFAEEEKKLLLADGMFKNFSGQETRDTVNMYYKKFVEANSPKDYGHFMAYLDLKIRVPEIFLLRVDRMCMAHSVEARLPFLDHHFVEFAMAIPQYIKIKNNVQKYILKKMASGFLGPGLVNRQKMGWGSSAKAWYLARPNSAALMRDKFKSFNARVPAFNAKYLDKLLKNNKDHSSRLKLWQLFSFILWHEYWIEGRRG